MAIRDRAALVRAGQNDFMNLEFKSDLRPVTGPGRLDKTVAESRHPPASGYPEERLVRCQTINFGLAKGPRTRRRTPSTGLRVAIASRLRRPGEWRRTGYPKVKR